LLPRNLNGFARVTLVILVTASRIAEVVLTRIDP